jgi:uncharacterized protein
MNLPPVRGVLPVGTRLAFMTVEPRTAALGLPNRQANDRKGCIMAESTTNTGTSKGQHWLVAAWPGMANVAVISAAHLIQKLGLKPTGVLPPRGHFDIEAVEVRKGVISRPTLPKNVFYTGQIEGTPNRLSVFIGEAQPSSGAYAFAHELLETAKGMGVDRVVTFASIATQLHPTEDPTVYGAATQASLVESLEGLAVRPLVEGQIGGLNGVVLGAAAERGVPGVCLLGEIPFFAVQVPNPKAAKAVLDAFGTLSGIEINLEELGEHAVKVDRVLLQMLEKIQQSQGEAPESGSEFEDADGSDESDAEAVEDAGPDLAARERIEGLFEAARKDRSQGVALKRELDRLGVYSRYENRFLDLFKRAG